MGIPYSRQINAAFDQVTPLVASGFRVLETTKNISILLSLIQVLTVILLFFIQLSLLALLVTVNPDLAVERKKLVTPVLRWCAGWIVEREGRRLLAIAGVVVAVGVGVGAGLGVWVVKGGGGEMEDAVRREEERQREEREGDGGQGMEK